MTTFVILLRGVMPTGKNKVPMAPLRESLTAAGLDDVQTYIQSGNIIATSNITPTAIEKLVHDVIQKKFGGDIAVIAKTAKEFAATLKQCPFKITDDQAPYFSLLASTPDKKRLTEFKSIDFSPDQVRITKNTIYTLYATKHSDSKFTNNYFERKLKVTATTRNFNTMKKLVALSGKIKAPSLNEMLPDEKTHRQTKKKKSRFVKASDGILI